MSSLEIGKALGELGNFGGLLLLGPPILQTAENPLVLVHPRDRFERVGDTLERCVLQDLERSDAIGWVKCEETCDNVDGGRGKLLLLELGPDIVKVEPITLVGTLQIQCDAFPFRK